MRSTTVNLIATAFVLLCAVSSATAGPIESRITVSSLALPQSLEANSSSWCTWGSCTIGPRLYLAPRSDGTFLVGWTDNFGNGHVSTVIGSTVSSTHNFSGSRVRGLVAHDNGTYAVLLKNGTTLQATVPGETKLTKWICWLAPGGAETHFVNFVSPGTDICTDICTDTFPVI